MLLKPNPDFYSSRHPVADDVLLLIEVADRSLAYDQTQKLRLYALHNVPEYWRLNLNDNCLEVYRKPHGEVYAEKNTLYQRVQHHFIATPRHQHSSGRYFISTNTDCF